MHKSKETIITEESIIELGFTKVWNIFQYKSKSNGEEFSVELERGASHTKGRNWRMRIGDKNYKTVCEADVQYMGQLFDYYALTTGDSLILKNTKRQPTSGPFLVNCFVRHNSRRLLDEVKIMGDRDGRVLNESCELTVCCDTYYRNYDDERGVADLLIKEGYYDCGENVPLFLALSAIRDGSDSFQWFTDGVEWFVCPYYYQSFTDFMYEDGYDIDYIKSFHKATVEELAAWLENKSNSKQQ